MNQLRPLPTAEIYDGIEDMNLPADAQGWHSTNPIFAELIAETKAKVIIECGSWKGASAIHMARLAPEAKLYCVDTWFGGLDHDLEQQEPTSFIERHHGYPCLYFLFLSNIKRAGVHERVVPVPQTSVTGARFLRAHRVKADLIYIDGSHEWDDPYHDMEEFWHLLRPGGIMFGDDMDFPGVAVSYYRFLMELGLRERIPFKPCVTDKFFWIIRKPE